MFNKNKTVNVVDFTKCFWGHNLELTTHNITKPYINNAHGWYTRPNMILTTDNSFELKKNSIVVKKGINGGYWFARIKHIEWVNDPSDMFFCKLKTITSEKELNKLERVYIYENFTNYDEE